MSFLKSAAITLLVLLCPLLSQAMSCKDIFPPKTEPTQVRLVDVSPATADYWTRAFARVRHRHALSSFIRVTGIAEPVRTDSIQASRELENLRSQLSLFKKSLEEASNDGPDKAFENMQTHRWQSDVAMSNYLAALGVHHIVVQIHNALQIRILPTGWHALNRKAYELERDYGTHLALRFTGTKDKHDNLENTIYISFQKLATEDAVWSTSTDAVVSELAAKNIREELFVVPDPTNAVRLKSLLDPEAMWPGGVTHFTRASKPTATDFISNRLSFRTDVISEHIPDSLAQAMATTQRLSLQDGNARFMGLRKPDGQWILTVPQPFGHLGKRVSQDRDVFTSEMDLIQDALSGQTSNAGYELFIFYGNSEPGVVPVRTQQALQARYHSHVNTISDVFIRQKADGTLFYSIISRLSVNDVNISADVDLLRQPYRAFVEGGSQ